MTRNVWVAGKGQGWRIAGWGFAAVLLLLPAVAMRWTDEVRWTAGDFLFAAIMIGGTGGAVEFLWRHSGSMAYRIGVAAALAGAFALVWIEAAVGIVGEGGNLFTLLFAGVLLVAGTVAAAGRFRARGLARATTLAAGLQLVVGLAAVTVEWRATALCSAIAAVWLAAATLFRRAAGADSEVGVVRPDA